MGGIRRRQPPADQALRHALAHHPPQTAAGIPCGKMACAAAAEKWYCGPAHGQTDPAPDTTAGPHPSGYAARSAALREFHTGIPTSRYFTSTTGSMGGRPYFRLYRYTVSSYTKERSMLVPASAENAPPELNLLSSPCVASAAYPLPSPQLYFTIISGRCEVFVNKPILSRSPAPCGASPAGVFLFGRSFCFQGAVHR